MPDFGEMLPGKTLILGVGNPICGDDGAGPRVIEMLAEKDLPPHVTIEDAGTPGWGLPVWLDGFSSIILVDTMDMDLEPGGWRRFLPEEVRIIAQNQVVSLHHTDLANGLALSQALEILPDQILFYGIQPANTSPGTPMSSPVSSRLPEVVESILKDIGNDLP